MNVLRAHWGPEHTQTVDRSTPTWKREDMCVDSGATDTVCPNEFSPRHETQDTTASTSCNYYEAANDSNIGAHGRKVLEGMTDTWNNSKLKSEVADVIICM